MQQNCTPPDGSQQTGKQQYSKGRLNCKDESTTVPTSQPHNKNPKITQATQSTSNHKSTMLQMIVLQDSSFSSSDSLSQGRSPLQHFLKLACHLVKLLQQVYRAMPKLLLIKEAAHSNDSLNHGHGSLPSDSSSFYRTADLRHTLLTTLWHVCLSAKAE